MVTELVHLNSPQLISVLSGAPSQVDIHGRGTGKSYIIGWEINNIVRRMPRSVTAITGRTFGQIYTRTLPSSLKFLEQIGYEKDRDFVIGRRPPRGWLTPYEKITRYDNFISFSNGTGFLLLSQEREGSARGPNIDREIVDEALTLLKERYDQEVSPANRGNEEYFGKLSGRPVPQHHGFRYVSSMPFNPDQRWLLDFGKYYEEEAGIPIFDTWNRIVNLQVQLMQASEKEDRRLFCDIWNETVRLKKQITPFVSRSGVLFTLANAFDNLKNLGFSYIRREYEKQSMITFLIEILNWMPDRVEDGYYHFTPEVHYYYDASNDSYIRSLAENSNWNSVQLETPDSRFDLDCNPSQPLEIVPDWGSKISLFSVGQEGNFNFVTRVVERNGKFEKNKASERNNTVLPEEATHFWDAADKRMWTKYGSLLVRQSTFVNPRI